MFEQVNKLVAQATINPQTAVHARRGSMLGYEGRVGFQPLTGQGQGMAGRAAAMFTNESNPMMLATGNGKVFYGYRGMYVDVINLDGSSPFTTEADRLLAHTAGVQTSVEVIGQGGVRAAVAGMASGQGLFTTKISGAGQIVVLSHGGMFPLEVNGNVVGVDPQAYVGHSGNLRVEFKAKVGFRDVTGRGSGEAFQLHISGQGTVYVQASEQKF